jgi:hypothetical protein
MTRLPPSLSRRLQLSLTLLIHVVLSRLQIWRVDFRHLLDEAAPPERRAVLVDVLEQLAVVLGADAGVHRDCFVDSVGDLLGVPGVDDDGAVEGLGSTCEFGEDHDALTCLLAGNVFIRDLSKLNVRFILNNKRVEGAVTYQVHSITRTRHQADIADGVQSTELVKVQALVHEVDGHKIDGAEATVDTAHKLVDGRSEILILFDVLT